MNKYALILAISTATITASCAVTYKPPTTAEVPATARIEAEKRHIMAHAKRALVSAGYQITSANDDAGTISTSPRNLRITPAQADCGTTMGIDYLKDNRTTTRISIGIIADDGYVTVIPTIQGEYKPGDVLQNITLTCVSRGPIEQEMLSKIAQSITDMPQR